MYEATRTIKKHFPEDCFKIRTGNKRDVLKQKEKWEYINTKAHTKAQKEYCRRILKAINIRLVEYKYEIFKEKGGL